MVVEGSTVVVAEGSTAVAGIADRRLDMYLPGKNGETPHAANKAEHGQISLGESC